MKIITWNINSIRYRINLLEYLSNKYSPDVIALQETKVQDLFFPKMQIERLGYNYQYYCGEKSYNGVAILSRIPFSNTFTINFVNNEKRHVSVNINGIELHNFYIPAGGDIPDLLFSKKFQYKINYLQLIKSWFLSNRKKLDKLIILGDFNIAPHEHDVWSSKQLQNTVSHTLIERKLLLQFKNVLNLIDITRCFFPQYTKIFTWWSYRNLNWEKSDKGRRLDHIFISNNLSSRVKKINIIKEARSWNSPSDHVPCLIELQ